ncbi:MAG: hypothetical protein K6360_00615 [Deltaproteobacteria bacterium]
MRRTENKPTFGVFVDGGAHGRGSNGKSAPMDGGLFAARNNYPERRLTDSGGRPTDPRTRVFAGLARRPVVMSHKPIVTTPHNA